MHQERISANQKIAELQQEIAQLCERVNQLNKGAVKSVGWGKAREAKNVETPDKDGLVIAYSCNMGRVQTLWIHTAGWYSRTYPAGYSFVVAPAVKGVRWEVCAPIKKDPKGQTEFYEGFTVGDAHVLFIPLEVEYGPIKE
ncbi:MAG: hypothetical protein RMI90_04965 [Thermoguttaceae bacterium]|nr:hypothetical protein [Thermoguttaceae bacterium]